MANFKTAVETLAKHFAVTMADREPDVKILWENHKSPEESLDGTGQSWVRFSVREIEDRAADIGATLYRGLALLEVQVNTPLGEGMGGAQKIKRSVQEAMRETIAGITVHPATYGASGEYRGWYLSPIRFRVTIDETVV